jgi:hypothetical protein
VDLGGVTLASCSGAWVARGADTARCSALDPPQAAVVASTIVTSTSLMPV